MELVLELLAGLGPVVLVGLGIAGAMSGERRATRGRWIWPAAILALGIPVSIAAFMEMRQDRDAPAAHADVPATNVVAVAAPRPAHHPQRFRIVRAGRRGGIVRLARAPETTIMSSNTTRETLNVPDPMLAASKAHVTIPKNTLTCTGFTRNADGSWDAGDDTEPFEVGDAGTFTIQDQGPIVPDWMSVGGVDLFALLNAKCGGKTG